LTTAPGLLGANERLTLEPVAKARPDTDSTPTVANATTTAERLRRDPKRFL
jgi:hypothetical protein